MCSPACDRPGATAPGGDAADAWRTILRDLAQRVIAEQPMPDTGPWIVWTAHALLSAWQAIEAGDAPAGRTVIPTLEASFARELATERARRDASEGWDV